MRQNKKTVASSQIASQPANALLPSICVVPIIDQRPNPPSSRSTEWKAYLDGFATPMTQARFVMISFHCRVLP
jgi:hypothetical protein